VLGKPGPILVPIVGTDWLQDAHLSSWARASDLDQAHYESLVRLLIANLVKQRYARRCAYDLI
jgi:hypothetical protein